MGETSKDNSAQLGSGVSLTMVKVMCGSTELMGHLIKYFESQSRRLDRQTYQSCLSSFKPDYESVIKFNGVPILPPAVTSSRRDELQQYKKDAVLLEKRLKARHRQQHMVKADALVGGKPVCYPAISKQAARHLKFSSGSCEEFSASSQVPAKHEIADSFHALATAESGANLDEFGLHTMDSVNSDFMSLDPSSVPKVFNGLLLTSAKEQKISYDLDRLSKALHVQELASTSGSDVSDAQHINHSDERADFLSGEKFAEKNVAQVTSADYDVYTVDFSHISQSTADRVSSQLVETGSVDNFITNEPVDNVNSTVLEKTHNGHSSSSKCGSVTNTDCHGSNRSSPKSLKGGVHFASFVTEYINTRASQSLEYPTIVKKQMSFNQEFSKKEPDPVLPAMEDLGESRQRILLTRNVSNSDNRNSLLDNVFFYLDSDSPLTPPFNETARTNVFQRYGACETPSSDKENDASQLADNASQMQNKLLKLGNKEKPYLNVLEVNDSQHCESTRLSLKGCKKNVGEENSSLENKEKTNISPIPASIQTQVRDSQIQGAAASKDLVSASAYASGRISHVSSASGSSPTFLEPLNVPVDTTVSDSQGSSKSNTLTNTSESSSNTVRNDNPPTTTEYVAMCEVNRHLGYVNQKTGLDQIKTNEAYKHKNKDQQPNSPKKVNIDAASRESDTQDKIVTPSRNNICRSSYTLNEPSPALVQAHGRPEDRRERDVEQKTAVKANNAINSGRHSDSGQTVSGRKLSTNNFASSVKTSVPSNVLSNMEKEGKAEHINKYLNQVQFQHSLNISGQSWDTGHLSEEDTRREMEEAYEEAYGLSAVIHENNECLVSILDVLRSLAGSQGNLEQLTMEELLELHQQQMNEKRQTLIQQQQKDMEELFVQQRREVMLLEAEIKAAQQQEREQQEFLMQNAPENIKVKSRSQSGEYSPEQTGAFQNINVRNMDENLMTEPDALRPQFAHHQVSTNYSSGSNLKLQPKSYPEVDVKSSRLELTKLKSQLQLKKANANSTTDGVNDESQTHMKTVDAYSRSPLSMEDGKIMNMSTEFIPVATSPLKHRSTVLRSPLKYGSLHRQEKVFVPPEVFLPEMQEKFDKVTAAAKGYLTRCLLRSDKVQELIRTIRDTREFYFKFQTETPIKKGMFTFQDRALLERIVAQLQAALLDIHEIFFETPVSEQMAFIEQTHISEQEKKTKFVSKDIMRESGPKISQATLKTLERKRKSRDGAVMGAVNMSRPKTAPPATSSPRSADNRRHFGQLISNALRPLQGHAQISPIRPEANRSEKPLTRPKRIIAGSTKLAIPDLHKEGSVKLGTTTNRTSLKSSKQMSKPSKSWR